MSLAKILQYQDIDLKIYKEELNLSRSDEAKKANNIKVQISAAQQTLLKLDKDTSDVFREIERLENQLQQCKQDEKTDISFTSLTSIRQVDNLEKTLKEYSEQVANLERDAKKAFRRLADISAEVNKQFATGNALNNELKKIREVQNAMLGELKVKYKDELATLAELRGDISPEIFEKYKNLRDKRKMPAFVPYDGKNCSGCGMEIFVEVNNKLKNIWDMAECPSCRRIVYLEK